MDKVNEVMNDFKIFLQINIYNYWDLEVDELFILFWISYTMIS